MKRLIFLVSILLIMVLPIYANNTTGIIKQNVSREKNTFSFASTKFQLDSKDNLKEELIENAPRILMLFIISFIIYLIYLTSERSKKISNNKNNNNLD